MDFNVSNENGDAFLNSWEDCYVKLITFLSDNNNVKEKTIRASIDQVKANTGELISESKF